MRSIICSCRQRVWQSYASLLNLLSRSRASSTSKPSNNSNGTSHVSLDSPLNISDPDYVHVTLPEEREIASFMYVRDAYPALKPDPLFWRSGECRAPHRCGLHDVDVTDARRLIQRSLGAWYVMRVCCMFAVIQNPTPIPYCCLALHSSLPLPSPRHAASPCRVSIGTNASTNCNNSPHSSYNMHIPSSSHVMHTDDIVW